MTAWWQGFISGACAAVAAYLVLVAGALALIHRWAQAGGGDAGKE